MKLDKILDIPKWQRLQDALAEATGLAIITVDYKGVPITEHSNRRPFCDYVRRQPELNAFCQKCDARGGLEAVRSGEPYTYLCHCRIVDIAIPIMIADKYVGAIMAGEIKLSDESEEKKLEMILHSPNDQLFHTRTLGNLYRETPSMSLGKLRTLVNMLFELCNYIVEEAMHKNLVLELYEQALDHKDSGVIPEGYTVNAVKNLCREFNQAVTDSYIKSENAEKDFPQNKALQAVFTYIYEHKGEMVAQKRAADLCYLSAGHFSRLFFKETGEHYSHYYARLKIEWSKQLVEKTDMPIAQISEELGFNESGYFIKTFKKYEGITPAAYRKFSNNQNNLIWKEIFQQ